MACAMPLIPTRSLEKLSERICMDKDLINYGLAHHRNDAGKFRDPVEVAREKANWILENHHPEPLGKAKQVELNRMLKSAERELSD